MYKPVIFFDVDGVLLEWFDPFLKYLYENNIAESPFGGKLKTSEFNGYGIEHSRQFAHMGKTIYSHMKAFIDSEAWDDLKPIAVITHLETLKNAGYELRVLSQVSSNKDRIRRVQNLTRHFGGVFEDMHFTCWRTKKENFIRNFAIKNSCHVFLLDDKPDTVKAVGEVGRQWRTVHSIGICNNETHPYLIDEYWSMHRSGVNFTWCQNVEDAVLYFLKRKYM